MSGFGTVEDTMFIPMLGRIYASEMHPQILYDKKALSLKEKLPSGLMEKGKQSQYTLLASASRSANMDRHIRDFLKRRPDGAIVQLGCGLETTYDRNDNGQTRWYAVDLPDVIKYRRRLLPEPERETYLAANALVSALGGNARVLADEPYYGFIKRNGLKLITKISIDVSDRFGMVKMIHLALGN